MREVRCPHCNKLLMKYAIDKQRYSHHDDGDAVRVQTLAVEMKCTRSGCESRKRGEMIHFFLTTA